MLQVRVARDCLLGQYVYPDQLNISIDQSVRPINPPEGLLQVTHGGGLHVSGCRRLWGDEFYGALRATRIGILPREGQVGAVLAALAPE